MGSLALSSGQQAPDHRDRIIASLERENAELKERLREAQQETASVRSESARGAGELRRILSPLHQALKLVFGELDAIAPDSAPSQGGDAIPVKNQTVWDSWKKRLGGTTSKVIDALMTHGELDTAQLAIVTGLDRRTISNTCIYKLNQAQLINKNGGRFSLKEL